MEWNDIYGIYLCDLLPGRVGMPRIIGKYLKLKMMNHWTMSTRRGALRAEARGYTQLAVWEEQGKMQHKLDNGIV